MYDLYESNILNQPLEWIRILNIQPPSRLYNLDFKRSWSSDRDKPPGLFKQLAKL